MERGQTFWQRIDSARARDAACVIFGAWIAFVVAGLHFYGMVDDTAYADLMDLPNGLWLTWNIVAGGSLVALLAVLVGGVPLAWRVWRNAPAQRRFFWVPAVAFIVVAAPFGIALVVLLGRFSSGGNGPHLAQIGWLPVVYGMTFLVAAFASAWAVIAAARRATLPDSAWRFAFGAGIITSLAMVGMTLGALGWALVASQSGVAGFADFNPLQSYPTAGTMILTVGWMTLASLVALIGVARAWPFAAERAANVAA